MKRIAGTSIVAAIALALSCAALALAFDEEVATFAAPVISGEPQVGETLTSSPAAIHRWQRCDPTANPCTTTRSGLTADGWADIPGAHGEDDASYMQTEEDLGLLVRVLAKSTNTGTKYVSSSAVGPVAAAAESEPPGEEEPPPAEQPRPLENNPPGEKPPPGDESAPRPVFNKSGNLDPVEGEVWVKLPGQKGLVRIEDLTQIPVGSRVDVTDGRVDLTTRQRPEGKLQTIELWGGAFVLRQQRQGAITLLRLAAPLVRPEARSGGRIELASKRKGRRLWGRGKCRCRTKGRTSSGTARGTFWLTAERPKGTLTRVREGRVMVRDLVAGRKVMVRAGESYLARERRR